MSLVTKMSTFSSCPFMQHNLSDHHYSLLHSSFLSKKRTKKHLSTTPLPKIIVCSVASLHCEVSNLAKFWFWFWSSPCPDQSSNFDFSKIHFLPLGCCSLLTFTPFSWWFLTSSKFCKFICCLIHLIHSHSLVCCKGNSQVISWLCFNSLPMRESPYVL